MTLARVKTAETGSAGVPALTPKQRRFVNEYLLDLNGSAAARRAGYSPRTSGEQASRLLRKVSIRQAIQSAFEERGVRAGIDADYVVLRLRELAEFAPSAAARIRALELLGRHLGMFQKVRRHGGTAASRSGRTPARRE